MEPKISVVIPAYNAEVTIGRTLDSLKRQDFKDYEAIVVDDFSADKTFDIAKSYGLKVFRNSRRMGPAYSRNFGIRRANAGIIAFIDADCEADRRWLRSIYDEFKGANIMLLMGKVRIPKSGYTGDSISALGFPAGGNLGFEKVWKVDKDGMTSHISSCNFAARKNVFEEHGMFDEGFPMAGAEDTELSHRMASKGVAIRYCEKALVWHEPRASLSAFIKWQVYRGRTNYHLKKKIGNVGGFVRLRLWSSWNVFVNALKMPLHFPMIMMLLFLSFVLQQAGYFVERVKVK